MKKIAILLLALALLTGPALALSGAAYPAYDGQPFDGDGFGGSVDSTPLWLAFDASQAYSKLSDGMLTACFYAMDADESHYIELYLTLPETIAEGETYASDGVNASVSLFEVDVSGEKAYFAGNFEGAAYPDGSRFAIALSAVTRTEDALCVRGTLEAYLPGMLDGAPTGEVLSVEGARFGFTLPLSGAAAPAFTLPPDYREL